MSPEQEELRRLARRERRAAWASAKRIPGRAGDVASAFARQHPVWAMGGAAALAMGVMSRRQRASGSEEGTPSWPMALAAVGARFLPDVMRLAGLTIPDPPNPDSPDVDA